MQLVGQGPRGTRTDRLQRQLHIARHRHGGQLLLIGTQLVGDITCGSSGQQGPGLVVRRLEVEGAQKISTYRTTERADIGFLHAKAGLQKTQHRRMVEYLRVDPAATTPGRDHIQRNARPGTVDTAIGGGLAAAADRRTMREVLGLQIGLRQRGLACIGLVGVLRWRRGRRHMVEVAVVLVEVDQQHGLAPDLGIGRQRVQHLLQKPGALHRAGWAGVFAIDGRCIDPGHLGQLAFANIALEGVQVFLGLVAGQGVGHAFVQRVGSVVAGRIIGVVGQGLAGVGIRRIGRSAAGDRKAGGQIRSAEVLERPQHVVAPLVGHVLVADPAHPGFLQPLGISLPCVAGVGVAGHAVDGIPLVIHEGHVLRYGTVGACHVE